MNPPLTGEEANRLRRQGSEQAIQLALEGKWEEAVALNRSILASYPNDVDSWNRLGKSLLELGRFREASESYAKALGLDPVNSIAKRNIDRLSTIKDDEEQPRSPVSGKVAQDLFIEEVGKSGTTTLRGISPELLARLTAGDEVYINPDEEVLRIDDGQGETLGNVEPRLALRLLRLIKGGNKYAAAVKSVSESEVELILKEIYRDPSQTRLSFPAVGGGENARGYIKESLLRGLSGDDDDDEDERETDSDEWEEEPETADTGISFTRLDSSIEPEVDDEEEE